MPNRYDEDDGSDIAGTLMWPAYNRRPTPQGRGEWSRHYPFIGECACSADIARSAGAISRQMALEELHLEEEKVLGDDLLRSHVRDARQREHFVGLAGGEQCT